jgi:surfactin synthase thioesterase subunit
MSYGYNSGTAFSRAVTNIEDEAEALLDRLDGNRELNVEKTRPILFIAHSLGGLVVKKVRSEFCRPMLISFTPKPI